MQVTVFATELADQLRMVCDQVDGPRCPTRFIAPRYAGRALDVSLAPDSRIEALAAGLLLSALFHIRSDDQLVVSRYGKPALADGSASINISHGGSYCMLAVAPAEIGEIGVDVESVGACSLAAALRVFPRRTVEWIEASSDPSVQAERFCRSWTRLEAVLKAEGTGFEWDPRADGLPSGWHVEQTLWNRHIVSVAARRPFMMKVTEVDPIDLLVRARRQWPSD